jgi:hypothetical protein
VEESVVAIPRLELKQPLRVCSMKGTSYGASCVTEVWCMMLRKMGDFGGAKVGEAKTQVSPGGAGDAVRGRKGAKTGRTRLQRGFSRALEETKDAAQRSGGKCST